MTDLGANRPREFKCNFHFHLSHNHSFAAHASKALEENLLFFNYPPEGSSMTETTGEVSGIKSTPLSTLANSLIAPGGKSFPVAVLIPYASTVIADAEKAHLRPMGVVIRKEFK